MHMCTSYVLTICKCIKCS